MKKRKFMRTVRVIGAVVLALISSFCLCMPSFATISTPSYINFQGVNITNVYFQSYTSTDGWVTYDDSVANVVSVVAYVVGQSTNYRLKIRVENPGYFSRGSNIKRVLSFQIPKQNIASNHVTCSYYFKVVGIYTSPIAGSSGSPPNIIDSCTIGVETKTRSFIRTQSGTNYSGTVSDQGSGSLKYEIDKDYGNAQALTCYHSFSVDFDPNYTGGMTSYTTIEVDLYSFTYSERTPDGLSYDYDDTAYDDQGLDKTDSQEAAARGRVDDSKSDFNDMKSSVGSNTSLLNAFSVLNSMFNNFAGPSSPFGEVITYSFLIGSVAFLFGIGTSSLLKSSKTSKSSDKSSKSDSSGKGGDSS